MHCCFSFNHVLVNTVRKWAMGSWKPLVLSCIVVFLGAWKTSVLLLNVCMKVFSSKTLANLSSWFFKLLSYEMIIGLIYQMISESDNTALYGTIHVYDTIHKYGTIY
jgi:hypothetical protein